MISSPEGIGGAEQVLAALATDERPGWEHAVVNVAGDNRALAAACPRDAVQAPPAGLPGLGPLRAAASALSRLDPDLVHAHLPLAMVAVAAPRRRPERARLATHHHGDHFVAEGRRLAARLDRTAGARFDTVVAPSEAVRAFLLQRYGYAEDAVRTIVNGWSGSPQVPSATEKAPDPTVICVANFRPQKNHELLLLAFTQVRERLPRARLLLVGGGPREDEIRRLTDSLGLRAAVDFAGRVDDVWPHLGRSHLFALASDHEPLGIAVLEAMAAGLPVVGTAVGGVPELVRPGVNGELVARGDAAAMATAIVSILESPQLASELGAAGRATASGHTAARMVDRYVSLYSELLS